MKCKCGDPISGQADMEEHWTSDHKKAMQSLRKTRCETCSRELAVGTIPRLPSTMHGTGGGSRIIRSGKEMG